MFQNFAGRGEGGASFFLVTGRARNDRLVPGARVIKSEINLLEGIARRRRQRPRRCRVVVPDERNENADRRFAAADIDLMRLFCEGAFENFRIAARSETDEFAPQTRDRKVESGSDASVGNGNRLIELSQESIGIGQQVARIDVPRIQVNCADKIAFAFLPATFASMQVSGKSEKGNAVRHRRPGQRELFLGSMVVALATKI